MKIALLVTSLSMFLTPVCAQRMSLDDCMRYAVEHNTGVATQTYQNYIYKQDKVNAVAGMLPSVAVNSSVSKSDGRYLGDNNMYVDGSSLTNYYELSAYMPVFNGFSRTNTLRATRMMHLMGKETLQQTKDEKALKTMEAYFNVVYYTKSVQNVREQLSASQQTLLKTQKMGELGMKSEADVAQVEAQVASDDLLLTQEENRLENAVLALKDAMNFPFDDSLSVDVDLPIEMIDGEVSLLSLSEGALDRNPRMIASQYNLRNSQLLYSSAKGQLFPSLGVGASYSTDYKKNLKDPSNTVSFSSQLNNKKATSIYASINIPIFSGLNGLTNAKRAKGRMKIAELQNEETRRAIQLEMSQTSMQMNGYAKEFIQAAKKVESTDLAYQATLNKYDQGMVDAVDLQTSANLLLTAKSQKLNARLQYIIKYRMMEYYNGTPLIREQ